MTRAEAIAAVSEALPVLTLREVLELCAERADQLRDDAGDDKWARFRAASDHRNLLNLRDRINN